MYIGSFIKFLFADITEKGEGKSGLSPPAWTHAASEFFAIIATQREFIRFLTIKSSVKRSALATT